MKIQSDLQNLWINLRKINEDKKSFKLKNKKVKKRQNKKSKSLKWYIK